MPRSARRTAPPGRAGGRRGQQFRGFERARARPAIPASAPPADRAAARGLTTRTPRTLCVGRRVRLDLSRWPLSRAQRRPLASARCLAVSACPASSWQRSSCLPPSRGRLAAPWEDWQKVSGPDVGHSGESCLQGPSRDLPE